LHGNLPFMGVGFKFPVCIFHRNSPLSKKKKQKNPKQKNPKQKQTQSKGFFKLTHKTKTTTAKKKSQNKRVQRFTISSLCCGSSCSFSSQISLLLLLRQNQQLLRM